MLSIFLVFLLSQALANDFSEQITQLAGKHEQVIVASAKQGHSLSLYEKINGSLQKTWGPIPVVFGKNGIAEKDKKIEGDGKTPSGFFEIEGAFGYFLTATDIPYRVVKSEDKWIDDVDSADYNTWISGETSAKSYEKLKRDDDLYEYALITSYNRKPIVKGSGSAIFIHVWRGPDSTTAGCVAMDKKNMIYLLKKLSAKKKPAILISKDF